MTTQKIFILKGMDKHLTMLSELTARTVHENTWDRQKSTKEQQWKQNKNNFNMEYMSI